MQGQSATPPPPGCELLLSCEAWLVVAAWVAVGIAVLSGIKQGQATQRALSAETFSRLLDRWDSVPMRSWRQELAAELISKKLLDIQPRTIDEVMDFFEDLGVMLEKRWLDADAVWHSFATAARHYWVALHPYVLELRKESNDQTYYCQFEYLINRLEAVEMKRQGTKRKGDIAITTTMANRFLAEEASMDTR